MGTAATSRGSCGRTAYSQPPLTCATITPVFQAMQKPNKRRLVSLPSSVSQAIKGG